MNPQRCAAPQPGFRLIPSRYPPIDAFDRVTTPEDAAAVMELAGWTNDRLVKSRLERLPAADWVFGRANASVVMAAFLHPPSTGTRFAGPELGAWYASAALTTAIVEVGHHLRREILTRGVPSMTRVFRAYTARLDGEIVICAGAVQDSARLRHSSSDTNFILAIDETHPVACSGHGGLTR